MNHQQGRMEVICGSMFSGKSEELIRRLRRAIIAKQKIQVFKPSLDDRYGVDRVTSHDGRAIEAIAIEQPEQLLSQLDDDTTVVGIDEVQFFPMSVISVIHQLIDRDIRVIIAGLDMDFRGEPFGAVPTLMAQADHVEKLHAICVITGEPATHTQRLVDGKPAHYDDPVILVGADETYEPRSRRCHDVPGRPW